MNRHSAAQYFLDATHLNEAKECTSIHDNTIDFTGREAMKINLISLVLFLIPSLVSATELNLNKQRFSVNTSIGYLSGTAHEYVYDPDTGAQLSHLVWKMETDPIIRAEGVYQLNSWLEANLNGWINLSTGNGVMDDYDWFPPIVPFAMWSHHPDTHLNQANEADINLKIGFLKTQNYKLSGILGYQRTLYSFVAKGGCYNYYYGAVVGCFPEDAVEIGYKQTYNMPYLGIAGHYLFKLWELSGLFKYSNQVAARDIDQHYGRMLTFYEGSNKFKYYNLSLNLGYYIKPQIKLFTEGSFNQIPNKKTGTVLWDQTSNDRIDIPGAAAGLSNKNYILSFGIQFTSWG